MPPTRQRQGQESAEVDVASLNSNERVCSSLGSLNRDVSPSPSTISNCPRESSPKQQLSYDNSLSSTFRPINYLSSSPFQNTIQVLNEMERQSEIERLQEIERQRQMERMRQFEQMETQRKIERLEKFESLHRLELERRQMETLCENEGGPQFGQMQQPQVQNSQEEKQQEEDDRYTKSQILYGQWLARQRQLDPIPRPWAIWAVGIIDILSIVPSIGVVAYESFINPHSDPVTNFWSFFIVSVFTVIRLLMGVGLIAGLRSRDDSSTLWYCQIWICCQSIFIVDSGFTLFVTLILAAQRSSVPPNFSVSYMGLALKGVFRLLSLIILIRFKNKLQESQRVFHEAYKKHQQNIGQGENADTISSYDQQRQNSAAGGDVISPYIAVLLGL